jgi:hypothetical protein
MDDWYVIEEMKEAQRLELGYELDYFQLTVLLASMMSRGVIERNESFLFVGPDQ